MDRLGTLTQKVAKMLGLCYYPGVGVRCKRESSLTHGAPSCSEKIKTTQPMITVGLLSSLTLSTPSFWYVNVE
jgi:hypothetical protein